MHLYTKRLLTFLLVIFVNTLSAQEKHIEGIVTNNSEPISGVTIYNKNSNKFTESNFDGNFSIVAQKGDSLLFSYVGLKSKTILVSYFNSLKVNLENNNVLDEVTITALGIKRQKKTIGYSTQSISSNEINTVKRPNIINAISGKIAGVNVTNSSGAVGSESRIVIRGLSSINGCLLYTSPSPRDA